MTLWAALSVLWPSIDRIRQGRLRTDLSFLPSDETRGRLVHPRAHS